MLHLFARRLAGSEVVVTNWMKVNSVRTSFDMKFETFEKLHCWLWTAATDRLRAVFAYDSIL